MIDPGRHCLKYKTSMCSHTDPHFQTSCHWMTTFVIFHILLSPNDPHFQNALSLNDPIFRNKMLPLNDPFLFFRNTCRCSYWMTPIFTNKWWCLTWGLFMRHKVTMSLNVLQWQDFLKSFSLDRVHWKIVHGAEDLWKSPLATLLVFLSIW